MSRPADAAIPPGRKWSRYDAMHGAGGGSGVSAIEVDVLGDLRAYAEYLAAYSASYGPTESLSDLQRGRRDALRETGEILLAILNVVDDLSESEAVVS